MIKKPNKLIQYVSIALGAVLACGAFMSSTNFSLSNIVRSRASETINGRITFTNNGSNVKSYSGGYFVQSKTQTGMNVYLQNITSVSPLSSGLVSILDNDSSIVFSTSNSSSNPEHQQFQKITRVSAVSNTETERTIEIFTSTDGRTYTDSGRGFIVTSSGGSFEFTSNFPTYLKLGYYNGFNRALYLTELSIDYTCSPAETRTLESIEVETSPTKTEYTEGDHFDPTGLVITASYDDGSEEDIAYSDSPSDFTFYPSTSAELSTSDESVSITYGGKSTSQAITVSQASTQFISGTFSFGTSTKWQFIFNEDLTGEYIKLNGSGTKLAGESFKYTLTDSHVRIYDVVISGSATWTNDWFLTKCINTASDRRYVDRETENDTGTYSITTFTIYTWNTTTSAQTLRTFTKIVWLG